MSYMSYIRPGSEGASRIAPPAPPIRHSSFVIRHSSASSAFTMVEIAISLAVIGFALVAIIGILPSGTNVQKENREETIIGQDASLFIDAIRSGTKGMD